MPQGRDAFHDVHRAGAGRDGRAGHRAAAEFMAGAGGRQLEPFANRLPQLRLADLRGHQLAGIVPVFRRAERTARHECNRRREGFERRIRTDRVGHLSRSQHRHAEQRRGPGGVVHAGGDHSLGMRGAGQQPDRSRLPTDVRRCIDVHHHRDRQGLHQPGHEQSAGRSEGVVHLHRHQDQSV